LPGSGGLVSQGQYLALGQIINDRRACAWGRSQVEMFRRYHAQGRWGRRRGCCGCGGVLALLGGQVGLRGARGGRQRAAQADKGQE